MKCKECKEFACIKRSENSNCFFEEMYDYAENEEEELYWKHFRAEAAKDILSNSLIPFALREFDEETINVYYWAEQAVLWADNLITKLKEKEEK